MSEALNKLLEFHLFFKDCNFTASVKNVLKFLIFSV